MPQFGFLKDLLLENNEYGIYVKGGSILPVKLHGGALSIMRTAMSPIRLDVYLDSERAYAEGLLYLDDGLSFKYQTKKEKALIKYIYQNGKITC